MFVGSDRGGETAAICLTMLANGKRYRIEPLAYVRGLLVALAFNDADLEALLPDVWIAAHPEHFLQYRRVNRKLPQSHGAVAERTAAPRPGSPTRPLDAAMREMHSTPAGRSSPTWALRRRTM
jgi:hypothetical protein